jgi:enoyl-CoA hydratase
VNTADALYCGFATHAMKRDSVEALLDELSREHPAVEDYLRRFAVDPGPAPLATLQPAIDRCFARDSVEAILGALAVESADGGAGAEWAEETRASLLTKSFTSLKITLRQLAIGRDYDLDAALALEYRLTQHLMAGPDFYEGVRAMLIDRDRNPQWRPATLAEVTESMIDAYFAPIGDRELRFA